MPPACLKMRGRFFFGQYFLYLFLRVRFSNKKLFRIMKKPLLIFLLMPFLTAMASEPQYSFEKGKVSADELRMTVFPEDSTAGAFMIYEKYSVSHTGGSRPVQTRRYESKLKILDPSQVFRSVVVIPYYVSPESGGYREEVSRIWAVCYNTVDGEEVASRLNPAEVITEDLGGRGNIYFAVPEARAGSVIEYGWTVKARGGGRYMDIPPFMAQGDIPLVKGLVSVAVSGGTRYMAMIHDYAGLKQGSVQGVYKREPDLYKFNNFDFEFNYVPAFRDEPFLWCAEDMRSRVEFMAVSYDDGVWVHNIAPQWGALVEHLRPELMPDVVKVPEALAERIAAIPDTVPVNRAREIRRIVAEAVKWNGEYSLKPHDADSVLAAGAGSSADINNILLGALRSDGCDARPLLAGPRSMGRLPIYPVSDEWGTFIVEADMPGSTRVYLDATDPFSDIGMFGENLMTDRARRFKEAEEECWTDLSVQNDHRVAVLVQGQLSPDGLLECEAEAIMYYAPAYAEGRKFRSQLFDGDYRRNVEKHIGAGISNFSFEPDLHRVLQRYEFTCEGEVGGDGSIEISLPFPAISENPFPPLERIWPVELDWPLHYQVNTIITLPEGYTVDEIPPGLRIGMKNYGAQFTELYGIGDNNVLYSNMNLKIDRIFYSAEEYMELHNFIEAVKRVQERKVNIVLK